MELRIIKKSTYEYTNELFLGIFVQERVSEDCDWTDVWFEPHYDHSKEKWVFTFDEESAEKYLRRTNSRVYTTDVETAKDILNQYKHFLKWKRRKELKKIEEAEIRKAEAKREEEERLKRKDEILAYKEVFFEDSFSI